MNSFSLQSITEIFVSVKPYISAFHLIIRWFKKFFLKKAVPKCFVGFDSLSKAWQLHHIVEYCDWTSRSMLTFTREEQISPFVLQLLLRWLTVRYTERYVTNITSHCWVHITATPVVCEVLWSDAYVHTGQGFRIRRICFWLVSTM